MGSLIQHCTCFAASLNCLQQVKGHLKVGWGE